MSIGVIVGKIKILKHCVECICTLLRWIYIDCSNGPQLACAARQMRVTQIEARSAKTL